MVKKWDFFSVVAVCFVGVEHGVTCRVCCAFYFKFFLHDKFSGTHIETIEEEI